MNTTGCSEGINSIFDGFVTSKTNLREFVIKYEQTLKKIIEKESYEDFESEHKYRIIDDGKFLLKHEVNSYKVQEKANDNAYHTYIVKTKLGGLEEFVVKLNLQTYEDPNISQTKGKKRDVESSRRIKSSIEVALNKKKRTCRLCSKFGHDKRNCSLNPKRKKMESTSDENEETQEIDQDMESSDDY
ncbi:hypothetical protein Ddye_000346 [Dipteronia dyeriana]|uniref:Protein FAR1-RELATED SEQUENCE n=1 Tax=Dipteronia dyeriana TaxID=168575 RepID=A0AAD9XM68_9ROSI|nr:hypothetical protein Ddye_000346 [Dipteronia dyeriana]